MERIQKILFPVDYSRQCHLVSYAVAAMARKFDAEITILHVLAIPPGSAGDWYAYLNLVDVRSIRVAAREELDRYLIEELKGAKVRRRIVEGEPAESIVQFAARSKPGDQVSLGPDLSVI